MYWITDAYIGGVFTSREKKPFKSHDVFGVE